MFSREKINTYCLYMLKRKFNPKTVLGVCFTCIAIYPSAEMALSSSGWVVRRPPSSHMVQYTGIRPSGPRFPFLRSKIGFNPLFPERQEWRRKKTASSRHQSSLLPLCRRHRRVLIMNPTVSPCTLKHAARLIPGLTYGCGDVPVR